MVKTVNISTVSSWQEELYILSTSNNPMDIQIPEQAEIFLLHFSTPSALPSPTHGCVLS